MFGNKGPKKKKESFLGWRVETHLFRVVNARIDRAGLV